MTLLDSLETEHCNLIRMMDELHEMADHDYNNRSLIVKCHNNSYYEKIMEDIEEKCMELEEEITRVEKEILKIVPDYFL